MMLQGLLYIKLVQWKADPYCGKMKPGHDHWVFPLKVDKIAEFYKHAPFLNSVNEGYITLHLFISSESIFAYIFQ